MQNFKMMRKLSHGRCKHLIRHLEKGWGAMTLKQWSFHGEEGRGRKRGGKSEKRSIEREKERKREREKERREKERKREKEKQRKGSI
jgi:hypothetical protein